jgi:hypothetical protein
MSACPICGKSAAARATNASAPFCCARCKQIDLGVWFGEGYRIETNESDTEPSYEEEDLAAGNRRENVS